MVRRFYEVLNDWLTAYWSDPEQPLEQSPGVEKVFDHLDPEAEWDWIFSPETFRGREQLLQAVADWLETKRLARRGRAVDRRDPGPSPDVRTRRGTRQGQRHSRP